jgi:hypothetical protein
MMMRYAVWILIFIAISIGLWPGWLGAEWLLLGGNEPGPNAAMLAALSIAGVVIWAQAYEKWLTWKRIFWTLGLAILATWLTGAYLKSILLLQTMGIIAGVTMVLVPVHALLIGLRRENGKNGVNPGM